MATSTYDYEDVDKGPELTATILVLFFVATIPFVLRLYTRLSTRLRTYGTDDTLLVGAWVYVPSPLTNLMEYWSTVLTDGGCRS